MIFKIFQIYFKNAQLAGIDPAFKPYDNSKSSNPDYREFYVFRKEYLEGKIDPAAYTGFLSWKFQSKTGISGTKFIEFCQANPGYDVYFINPFPLHTARGNVWDDGERFHPGIKELTQSIFNALKLDVSVEAVPNSLRITGYCNFWAGNKKFWDAYMAFCLPIIRYVETQMNEQDRKRLFSRADRSSGASYFAYIVERLFTTFLWSHPEFKALGYRYSRNDLASRFSVNEIQLYEEALKVEDAHPGVIDPFLANPALRLAFFYYGQAKWDAKPFRLITKLTLEWLWRKIPFKPIFRNSIFSPRLNRWYQLLRPKV